MARALLLVVLVLFPWAASSRVHANAIERFLEIGRAAFDAGVKRLRPGTTVPWMTSDGRLIELIEWRTANVSLLTERDDYDPVLVSQLVRALDAYWMRCCELCGNAPPPDAAKGPLVKGRAIFAEAVRQAPEVPLAPTTPRSVPVVGMIGVARVSIGTELIEELLRGFAQGQPRAPLGDRLPTAIARCFVFFETELAAAAPDHFPPIAGALAFLLAGEAQESLGWVVPPDPRPLEALVDEYQAASTATFASTLGQGKGIGSADAETLWTALLLRLRHASGQTGFVKRLWKTLYECPPANNEEVALGNLVVAMSAAGATDFSDSFRAWHFPISPMTASRVREALTPRKVDVRPRSR